MEAKELRIGNYVKYATQETLVLDLLRTHAELGYYKDSIGFERKYDEFKPINITDEYLLNLGFENWGLGTQWNNEYESYVRYVRHNDLDGTSNFEIHYVKSTYGNTEHYQYIISCDEDDRLNWGEDLEYIHQLQNLYFALTNKELEWSSQAK